MIDTYSIKSDHICIRYIVLSNLVKNNNKFIHVDVKHNSRLGHYYCDIFDKYDIV